MINYALIEDAFPNDEKNKSKKPSIKASKTDCNPLQVPPYSMPPCDNSQVSFEVALGLSNYCQPVNFVSTTFKINELKKYFR